MKVIFKIALRNLVEHKAKTLIIGIMIAVEIFILVLGNSILDTASAGLKKAYIENYTGHLMVFPKPDDPLTVISIIGKSGVAVGEYYAPALPDYSTIEEYVKSLPEVTAYTPQLSALGSMGSEEKKALLAIFFGIDPASYQKMFASVDIIDGRYLLPGEEGILLSEKSLEILKKVLGDVKIGDKIIVTGLMGMNIKIREVTLRGIYRFKSFNTLPLQMAFIDAQELRALIGLSLGGSAEVALDSTETSLLSGSEADIFADISLVDPGAEYKSGGAADPLAGLKEKSNTVIQSNTWNFILLKLKNESSLKPLMMKMNSWFIAQKINARVQDWTIASGGSAIMADRIKSLLNIIIIIISVVAVIIIINTLVISVLERTPEIGMMRALGSQKGFIWKMLITETMLIALTFGTGGIILGMIVVGITNVIGIPTGTGILSSLLGTGILRPELSLPGLLWPLVYVVLIGILSQFYPAFLATRIPPIKAIHAE